MRLSKQFTKTLRETPKDVEDKGTEFLIRGGFIDQLMAGVYTLLPLGFRVAQKIENIIREEMNALGAEELFMPTLQPRELWEKTGRWEGASDIMYRATIDADLPLAKDKVKWGLAFTHEEVIAQIAKKYIASYRDLPKAVYQLQTKFRQEPRAKAGLLRGREFGMKDLYSFHASKEDLNQYYEKVKEAYLKIFKRCGLETIVTEASGGVFSKEYSHEFQVLYEKGEDTIFYCKRCHFSQNKEIFQNVKTCPKCKTGEITEARSIEVGNIFKLGTKYSQPLGLTFKDEKGTDHPVIMASYGIGPGRVMGAVAGVFSDEKGLNWPAQIAPYGIILVDLTGKGERIYQELQKEKIDVLWDDREEATAGEKFADADLLGIPFRAVVSEKTGEKVELKRRGEEKTELLTLEKLKTRLNY